MNTNPTVDMKPPCILIVDDEEQIRLLFKTAMKKAGFSCEVSENGKKALEILTQREFDVVISDIDMPEMDGIEMSRKILALYDVDIIIMTGKVKSYRYEEIITLGASDFVEKPFSLQELVLRINRVLRERHFRKKAKKSHDELKEAYLDSIHRLVMASEYKDEDTGDHIVRIGEYCKLMAQKFGLEPWVIENISYAAPMHDVGKIGIPDKILLKPDKLTVKEFETMKTHTTIGAKLLSRSRSGILKMAKEIALSHHERYDGSGYPNGIAGEDIPIVGRIVAIADTFDALTSKRPYKDPYPIPKALEMIKKGSSTHFDPKLVELFVEYFHEFMMIRGKIGSFEKVDAENYNISQRDKEGLGT